MTTVTEIGIGRLQLRLCVVIPVAAIITEHKEETVQFALIIRLILQW